MPLALSVRYSPLVMLFLVGAASPAMALGISWNGQDITGKTVTVEVGQEVSLTGPAPYDPSSRSFGWNFSPQNPVANVTVIDPPTCPAYPAVGVTPCAAITSYNGNDTSKTTFYFYIPKVYTVQYNFCSETACSTLSTTFNVVGPSSVSIQGTPGTTQIVMGASSGGSTVEQLSFGSPALNAIPGLTFLGSAVAPVGDAGNFSWLQVLQGDSGTFTTSSGGKHICGPITALDGVKVYPGATTNKHVANWFPYNTVNDSPASDLAGTTTIHRNFRADMWLIWTPSSTQNSPKVVPVPVGMFEWEWDAGAQQNPDGTYSVIDNSADSDVPYYYGVQYPENSGDSYPTIPLWDYSLASPFNLKCPVG